MSRSATAFMTATPTTMSRIYQTGKGCAPYSEKNFIYLADCKLCSQKNLNCIAENGGLFIAIVPKDRKEVKAFLKYLQKNHVEWEDAFIVESAPKDKRNIFKTHVTRDKRRISHYCRA